jgi:hypothetical protein
MASIPRMWLVEIVCSEPRCHEEREVLVDELAELDGLGCECGAGFVSLTVSEVALVHG